MRLLLGLAALAASLWPAGAQACSLIPEHIPASNFELVGMADAIVIASAHRSTRDSEGERQILFRTEAAVKGTPPPEFALAYAAFGRTRPSDNEDLSTVNPDAYRGACNRSAFARGGRYLVFLERSEDGRWQQVGMPFARINEDYPGEDNAWMRTVRRYVALQQSLSPMEQIATLTRMAETGRDPEGRPLSRRERADAAAHLGWISPWKPTPWLLDIYARAERGEPLPFIIGLPAADEGPPPPAAPAGSAAEAVESVLATFDEPYQPRRSSRLDPIRDRVLQSLLQGRHPDALPLFERLWASPETARPLRGLILRYFAENGHYPRAYRWIETELLNELESLPREEARTLLVDVAGVQQGDSWEEERARWRSDPHAASTWPALSRAIHAYQVRTFGEASALRFFDLDRRPR